MPLFGVDILISPLDLAVPTPDVNDTCPPVPLAALPAVAAAFFRQVNELNDATGFYLLRLSELVAQRKERRQKYHER